MIAKVETVGRMEKEMKEGIGKDSKSPVNEVMYG
jgi:hypothetical protein